MVLLYFFYFLFFSREGTGCLRNFRVTGFVVIFSNMKGRYKVFSLFPFFFLFAVRSTEFPVNEKVLFFLFNWKHRKNSRFQCNINETILDSNQTFSTNYFTYISSSKMKEGKMKFIITSD